MMGYSIIKVFFANLKRGGILLITIAVGSLYMFVMGIGLILAASEIPRIAGQFGLDTSTRGNIMSAVYAAQSAVSITRTIVNTVK